MSNTDHAFIWADLSSPEPDRAAAFYGALFGWGYDEDAGYRTAHSAGEPVAGLYETPAKFQAMGMPSFWMSYISVSDVASVVNTARAAGGKVELEAEDYALIRDPLGAGFTVHRPWPVATPKRRAGRRVGHALHCEDVSAVAPFYAALFGWRFQPVADGVYDIMSGRKRIAGALTLSEAERGRAQYWAVFIGVPTLDAVVGAALDAGGQAERVGALTEGEAAAITDLSGATLFVAET